MFRPAKQNRVFEDIIEQIEEAIFSDDLRPGLRLPSERELQKVFQTSRSTLREALRVLEQKGLVEIKTGSRGGAFVKRSSGGMIGEGLSHLIRFGEVTLTQITNFRLGMETLAVELAVQNAKPEQIEELGALVDSLGRELEGGPANWRRFFKTESLLHQALPAMAQNPLYAWVLGIIHANLWKYYEMLPREAGVLERAHRDWAELLGALKEGNVFQASTVMKAHLLEYHRHLQDYFARNRIDEREVARLLFEREV